MEESAKIVKTRDGSDTLFLSHLNEHYHSVHGALQESDHVYIKSGLDYWLQNNKDAQSIRVLEVGMGTGMNILLATYWAEEFDKQLNIDTLEPYPLKIELMDNYNYGEISSKADFKSLSTKLHKAEWNQKFELSPNVSIAKHETTLENLDFTRRDFDVVFFDAFAPNKQEEIWCLENFEKINSLMNNGGVLVTYCAQGKVRRTMQSAGLEVQRIQGPPGKREMLRAIKTIE